MDISHWDAAIHCGVQLAQYCDQTRSSNAISRRSPPVYSLALRLRNTKVPVWTHESIGYPKMDISHWDAAIHYGVQLAQYCDQTLSCYAISRRLPPLCSLALSLRNTKALVWTHESIGYPKMDISHWDAAIHYGIQLAIYCDQTRSFNAISRRSLPVYSLALRLRNTKVPVWTHESIGYPKMDISHWDAAIHYGIQLAQYCDQTISCYAISRRLPPPCSLALRLRNTKVPVWTHESIGYPKMDISHWDAAIHYGVQLAQYCDQTLSCYAIWRRLPPSVLPCPKTQEHQSTCVDSWVHRVPESGHQTLGRGNPLWRSACPILWSNTFLLRYFTEITPCVLPYPKTQEHQSTYVDSWVHRVPENGHQPLGRGNSLRRAACPILWSNPIVLRYFTKIAPFVLPCPKTQEHQSTCVDSWVHRVPENGHQPLGRGNSLWRAACPILWSNPIFKRSLSCYAISRRLPPLCSLALRLRNTKVPVWTHESIGYPKMDISHWDAAIHYGVQLAQYCDQTLSCYAISRRLPLLCSLALRLRNTKVPVWTHESIGYPKMDISHWDAAIHYGIQLAQYCDQSRSFNAISRRSPPVYSLALRLRNTKVPVWTHESIGYPKMDISHWARGNSLWRAACPILWSNPIVLRYFTKIAPSVLPCPKTQEHQSTCVDSWVHRVPENGHQPLGRGNSLWRSACPILWSNPFLLRYFTEIVSSVFQDSG